MTRTVSQDLPDVHPNNYTSDLPPEVKKRLTDTDEKPDEDESLPSESHTTSGTAPTDLSGSLAASPETDSGSPPLSLPSREDGRPQIERQMPAKEVDLDVRFKSM